MVPFLIVSESGSKSHLGSGFPLCAAANKSANFVEAPSATFRQKSGPTASGALKVVGSHSSSATTCATPGESSIAAPPANNKHKIMNPTFTGLIFIAVPFLCISAQLEFKLEQLCGIVYLLAARIGMLVFARASSTSCAGDAL